ncbi:hypothetical protein IWX48DRAFT_659813 [Phyllosticta citricarpa]
MAYRRRRRRRGYPDCGRGGFCRANLRACFAMSLALVGCIPLLVVGVGITWRRWPRPSRVAMFS